MPNEIIEAPDDSAEDRSNVEATTDTEVVETPEGQKPDETPTVDAEETQQQAPQEEEESIEFKGEKIPLSKIDQLMKDYENDSKWKRRNQEESEAIKRDKAELAQLQFLKSQIEQRPDIVQQLITPPKKRDYDTELQELYRNPPDPMEPNQVTEWNMRKDSILYERATSAIRQEALAETSRTMAVEHNNSIEGNARTQYVTAGKVDEGEFKEMTDFIVQNVRPVNDRYPAKAYEYAYKILFEDRYLDSIKQDAAKRAIAPLGKTKSGGLDAGKNKPQVQETEEDENNDQFSKAIRGTTKGKWISLPQ